MRQLRALILTGGLAAALVGCSSAEDPATTAADEAAADSAVSETVGERLTSDEMGSFDSGDLRGWTAAQGDESRTDFETGDVRAWTNTKGKLKIEPKAPEPAAAEPTGAEPTGDKPKG